MKNRIWPTNKLNFCLESRIKKKKKRNETTWKGKIFLTDQRRMKISYKYFYTCIESKKSIIDIINCDKFNVKKRKITSVSLEKRKKNGNSSRIEVKLDLMTTNHRFLFEQDAHKITSKSVMNKNKKWSSTFSRILFAYLPVIWDHGVA